MPLTDDEPRVLHVLRVKGLAEASAVARACGITIGEAEAALGRLGQAGLAAKRSGALAGWSLTPPGRRRAAELRARELDEDRLRAIAGAYAGFLELNPELLQACSDWQVRAGVPNDHHDTNYDSACVARLQLVDTEVQPVCARLSAALPRFEPYGQRLGAARERVAAGEHEWFTSPRVDSYHTVWFELHEDLLITLGRERISSS